MSLNVLLTGHEGYIGSVLQPMLEGMGHRVVGLDSGLFRHQEFGPPPPAPSGGLVRRDLRDVEAADLDGLDAVIHLAALSNDPLGDLDPVLTDAVNRAATVRLAELARQAGVGRFLFSSSCSNYGAAGDEPLDEESEPRPLTPYAVAKVAAERQLLELADERFSPVCLRNATAYGLSPRLRLDLVVNDLTARAVVNGHVRLLSDGNAWRPLVHVRDIAAAMIAVLEAPRPAIHGQTFNVCRSSENYRIRRLGEIVVAAVPGARLEIRPDAEADRRSYRVDGSRLERLVPGFRPQWTVRRGVEELAAAFRHRGLAQEHLDEGRYVRLAVLRRLLDDGAIRADLRPREPASDVDGS